MLVAAASELYKKRLLFSSLSDSLLIILFNSFNLMFKPINKANQHILFNTHFQFIEHSETPPLLNGLFFTFSLVDEKENSIFKFTLNKDKLQYYSDSISIIISENYNTDILDIFIRKCTEEIIGKYFELSNNERVSVELINKHIGETIANAPPNSFLKKIKSISESGFLYKYSMEFTDGTQHSILSPNILSNEVKPGDFGHHDGGDGFIFLPRSSIQ